MARRAVDLLDGRGGGTMDADAGDGHGSGGCTILIIGI